MECASGGELFDYIVAHTRFVKFRIIYEIESKKEKPAGFSIRLSQASNIYTN